MSAQVASQPFVNSLRTPRGKAITLGEAGGDRVTVRVQFEALWDAVLVDVRTDAAVADLIPPVLKWFGLGHAPASDFLVKLRGWEVKGADTTVGGSGAKNGSTFLVQYRHRRPVR